MTSLDLEAHTPGVGRARRHQTFLARLALLLLALIAELLGRALTHQVDVGRHVRSPVSAGADYYPFLLAAVKVGVALMLARLAWRFVKAHSVAATARRLLAAKGRTGPRSAPRMRIELSPRLWFGAFVCTSVIFLIQTDAERLSSRWAFFAPWLHTSALPVFAVLAVIVAVVYGVVARWLADYETYARDTAAHACAIAGHPDPRPAPTSCDEITPRGRFGLAFEVRPPPLPA